MRAVKVTHAELSRVLNIFESFMMCYRGYWICNNEIFRRIIEQLHYSIPEVSENLHKRIVEAVEKSPNCVRKLEEQTYHLYQAKEDFHLKQIIATVENFLMLFNPMTKFDLFRYWQKLEKSGYDPVTEYNKGIELFDSQFNPEPDKLFMIILQVCRFLKEFSDFETDITPVFRHPLIKDKIGVGKKKDEDEEEKTQKSDHNRSVQTHQSSQLEKSPQRKIKVKQPKTKESSVNKDLSALHIQAIDKRKIEDPLGLNLPFYNEDNELSEVEEEQPVQKVNTSKNFNTFNYLDVIGLLRELKIFRLTKEPEREKKGEKETSMLRYEQKNIPKRPLR